MKQNYFVKLSKVPERALSKGWRSAICFRWCALLLDIGATGVGFMKANPLWPRPIQIAAAAILVLSAPELE